MELTDIERAVTAWVAELLGLAPDEGVYRGGIPAGYDNAAAVMITGRAGLPGYGNFTTCAVQVFGKYADRGRALNLAGIVGGALPAYGVTAGGVELAALTPAGDAAVFPAADDGRKVWCASVNLTAAARKRRVDI